MGLGCHGGRGGPRSGQAGPGLVRKAVLVCPSALRRVRSWCAKAGYGGRGRSRRGLPLSRLGMFWRSSRGSAGCGLATLVTAVEAGHGGASHGMFECGSAGLVQAVEALRVTARSGEVRFGNLWHVMVRFGGQGPVKERRGPSKAGLGPAGLVMAVAVVARRGGAWFVPTC